MNSTGGVAEPGSKLYHLKARLEEAASAQTTTLASEVSTSTEEVSTEVADTTLVETTTACPEAELQEDFVQYPWHYIYYNNLYFRDATFDDCKTECLNTPNCRVMEFWYDVEYCAGADVTPLQLPSDWRSNSDWLYYVTRRANTSVGQCIFNRFVTEGSCVQFNMESHIIQRLGSQAPGGLNEKP
nr:hypothetical protein BaRGS_022797 [Batillaria attramentaria]